MSEKAISNCHKQESPAAESSQISDGIHSEIHDENAKHEDDHRDDCSSSCDIACDHACCPQIEVAIQTKFEVSLVTVSEAQIESLEHYPQRVSAGLFRPPKG